MKKTLVLFGLLTSMQVVAQGPNLVANGDFTLESQTCSVTPVSWSVNNGVQPVDLGDGNGMWVDLTDCQWGNGGYLEQTVATVNAQEYELSFKLGCWKDERFTTGGVSLYVNGAFKEHFNYEDFTGTTADPLRWKTFKTCIKATSSTTTLKFVCAALATASTPSWVNLNSTTAGARVVAFDKVEFRAITNTNLGPELIVNGKFGIGAPGLDSAFCDTVPYGWTGTVVNPKSPYMMGIQWDHFSSRNAGDPWLDMTGCVNYGTSIQRWINQTIPTIIGQTYHISFAVGSPQYYEVGMILYIDGSAVDVFFQPGSSTSAISWGTFTYDFVATSTSTELRFRGTAFDANVPIIGLDNVSVKQRGACGGGSIGSMTSTVTQKVLPVTIGAQVNNQALISPNPVEHGASEVRLNVTAPAGTIEVIIADYMGRVYVNQRFDIREGGEQTLSVELNKANLTPGLYLLKVSGLDKPATQVLVVK